MHKTKFLPAILLSIIISTSLNAQHISFIADSNNHFAFKLYAELKKEKTGNLFFSPFSISTTLATIYAGAKNETAKQMSQALHFSRNQNVFHTQYKSYLDTIAADTGKGITLGITNSLWIAGNFKVSTPFSEIVKEDYHSELRSADFAEHTEQTRQEINAWVEDETHDRIKDLITKGMVNLTTKMVLVNAIYFKGKWEYPFKQEATRKAIFHSDSLISDSADFMKNMGRYKYYQDDTLQAIEIPYSGEKTSMVILLPKEINGIDNLEKKLDAMYYSKITKGELHSNAILSLPKFKISSESILSASLSAMGMPIAFSGDADFSGIAPIGLRISFVVHKAFINVSEEGTEAAAATGVGVRMTSVKPTRTPPVIFTANHAFLYLIKDNTTGAILFMGKITDPTKE